MPTKIGRRSGGEHRTTKTAMIVNPKGAEGGE
ncbi:MAG: hypothetical protein SLRJCFUN_001192 [Candidatus Fervidibacter sp.]